jgi:cysteine dioxygenase
MDELVRKINLFFNGNKKINYLKSFMEQYKGDDWISYITECEENYIKKLVFRNEDYELFIVSWMPGKGSSIHDHSKNGCLFKILRGELIEERYSMNEIKLESSTLFNENNIGYIENEEGLHRMLNKTEEIVVSLHLYSPPNYKIKSYDKNED